jgi:hypothetical protein
MLKEFRKQLGSSPGKTLTGLSLGAFAASTIVPNALAADESAKPAGLQGQDCQEV